MTPRLEDAVIDHSLPGNVKADKVKTPSAGSSTQVVATPYSSN